MPECKKTYKSKKGLKNHMQSVHQAIMNNVVSPMAATARTLFESHTVGEHEQPATQGNSAGQVNSPKVRSESYHQCGICDKSYQSKEENS